MRKDVSKLGNERDGQKRQGGNQG